MDTNTIEMNNVMDEAMQEVKNESGLKGKLIVACVAAGGYAAGKAVETGWKKLVKPAIKKGISKLSKEKESAAMSVEIEKEKESEEK